MGKQKRRPHSLPGAGNRKVRQQFKRDGLTLPAPEQMRQRQAQQQKLPITSQREVIINAVKEHQCVVVIGETGSGKTTQIPQYLLQAGLAPRGRGLRVGVTQPRRVAAVTLAQRVADELRAGKVGGEVGYSVRFEDCTSAQTRVKFLTDGMLLREAMTDNELSQYAAIVLDEAHERSVHTDVLLGLLRGVLRRRPSLKLLVMSATLDSVLFQSFLAEFKTTLLHVSGRQHPVEVFYTREPQPDYVEAALITVLQLHAEEPLNNNKPSTGTSGHTGNDILVFMTGQGEIEALTRLLNERGRQLTSPLIVTPIFAALSSEQQLLVFQPAPYGARKVILATNIAETSITIPGVRFVVDPGLVKMRAVHPVTGTESLWVEPVSQQQAWQRAGRAGRLGPGKCFRLFTEVQFPKLRQSTVPMLHRCNLAHVALQLKALGVDDLLHFPFPQPPSHGAMRRALETLLALGALDKRGSLTTLGRNMAALPLEPTLAKMLLESTPFGCSREMLALVSVLAASAESPFFANPAHDQQRAQQATAARQRLRSPDGDHLTLLNAFERATAFESESERAMWCKENFVQHRTLRKALDIREQLLGHLKRMGLLPLLSCRPDVDPVRRCLVKASFLHAAVHQPSASGAGRGEYRAVRSGQIVFIHPTSMLFGNAGGAGRPECVIFHELLSTSKLYMRTLTSVEEAWLMELVPEFFVKDRDGTKA